MRVMVIAVVMIVAIIVIAFVIYKSISGGDETLIEEHTERDKHSDGGGKEKGAIKFGSGFTEPPVDHGNHSVEKIYVCVYPSGVWVCPDCECENEFSRRYCCVCNKQR